MNIKPIKTEADYQSALKEIEKLFGAKPGSSEGDQLDVLITLVEAYEDEHYDIPAPDPIEAINYFMESRGLTRADIESQATANVIYDSTSTFRAWYTRRSVSQAI
jgi:HTH-type transcriptional regulator / antitoxin HigA